MMLLVHCWCLGSLTVHFMQHLSLGVKKRCHLWGLPQIWSNSALCPKMVQLQCFWFHAFLKKNSFFCFANSKFLSWLYIKHLFSSKGMNIWTSEMWMKVTKHAYAKEGFHLQRDIKTKHWLRGRAIQRSGAAQSERDTDHKHKEGRPKLFCSWWLKFVLNHRFSLQFFEPKIFFFFSLLI